MADKKSNEALEAYLEKLSEGDREWFEERIAIIQFTSGRDVSELEAARSAFKCFQNYKNQNERIAA